MNRLGHPLIRVHRWEVWVASSLDGNPQVAGGMPRMRLGHLGSLSKDQTEQPGRYIPLAKATYHWSLGPGRGENKASGLLAIWECNVCHILLSALGVEDPSIATGRSVCHWFVQSIQPVCWCREISQLFLRDILWNKCTHGVTNEQTCLLDRLPQQPPCLSLGSPGSVSQIASDLYITTKDDWPIRSLLLDQGNQERQLRVINDDHICAPLPWRNQRPILLEPGGRRRAVPYKPGVDLWAKPIEQCRDLSSCCAKPISFCVFKHPTRNDISVLLGEWHPRSDHTLQDIVVVLGEAEDPMSWFRNIRATMNERQGTRGLLLRSRVKVLPPNINSNDFR